MGGDGDIMGDWSGFQGELGQELGDAGVFEEHFEAQILSFVLLHAKDQGYYDLI